MSIDTTTAGYSKGDPHPNLPGIGTVTGATTDIEVGSMT